MRILGPPSAPAVTVRAAASAMGGHPRFVDDMFGPLWDEAVVYGVDPVGVIAQSWKETGGGQFGGRVTPEHYNTAGIKVRHLGYGGPATLGDEQLAHQAFPSWHIGARAHVQHLCAYAGRAVPQADIVDPRWWWVFGKKWVETFEELGGNWAPATYYGVQVVDVARRLQGRG